MPARADRGFTLIELLVVVAIIGTLAAIGIPTYLHQKQKGDRAAAVADMRNAALAVETYITGTSAGSYAPLDGVTETSPQLRDEGFNPSDWVTFRVSATITAFCIEGRNVNAPTKLLVYRSATGIVEIRPGGGSPCTAI